ncbi:hypothetical protein [Aromatoleum anaerobium]|nr:hypothetical protein [Aromatoleum anaerobium]MCK0506515.1 hypothetical protein [Aromatoleum anaerobium]
MRSDSLATKTYALSVLIPLMFGAAGARAEPPPPFAVTCNQLVVGPAKSVDDPIRINWDGAKLVTKGHSPDGKIETDEDRVISSKNLPVGRLGGVHFTFHTATHQTKAYRYLTSLKLLPRAKGYSLEMSFATVDAEGLLITAGSIDYDECYLQNL